MHLFVLFYFILLNTECFFFNKFEGFIDLVYLPRLNIPNTIVACAAVASQVFSAASCSVFKIYLKNLKLILCIYIETNNNNFYRSLTFGEFYCLPSANGLASLTFLVTASLA